MAVEVSKTYVLEEFRLVPEKRTLERAGSPVHLPNRPFQVLLYLIENRDRMVTRDELLERFWDAHNVYDVALTKCIGAIRKALDEQPDNPRFIETRWAEGYRFIGKVEEIGHAPSFIEIEKTRETRIVFEEENGVAERVIDIQSEPARAVADERLKLAPAAGPLSRKNLVIAACAGIILLIGGFAWFRTSQPDVQAPAKRSIAIMPLKNLTGDASNDYLADGMTESLINEISRSDSLRVISRSSVFQFKNKDASPQEIARALNVETILEGGIRRSGDRVRVETRLVNARDGSVVWASDSQEKPFADIFAIEDGIVCQLVAELKVKLCGDGLPAPRYKRNSAAYQAYLKGLYHNNRLDKENMFKAVEFYREALRIAPDYAPAHEGLAIVFTLMEINAITPPGESAPHAESHANRALELDENLVGAYLALGSVKTLKNYDLTERIRYYREAVRRSPNYLRARRWLSSALLAQGKFEEAEAELLRVQEADPLSYGVRLNLAELYGYWRKPDKAIEQANLMLVANPESKEAHNILGKAYMQKGMFPEAYAEFEKADFGSANRIAVLAAMGQREDAFREAEKFAQSEASKTSPYLVGCIFAGMGEKEKAIAWLEKAYELKQADLVSLKVDPAFDGMRDDVRYQDLLRRVGLDK